VEVQPVVVRNLALFVGCPLDDLTNYLAQFAPEYGDTHATGGNLTS